jgi:small subunit ribosomal protein S7
MYKKKRCRKKHIRIRFRGDAIYKSIWFAKTVNKFMRHGKKNVAEKHVLRAFEEVKKRTKISAHLLLFFTLSKARPKFDFMSRRFGKEYKDIPVPLSPQRQLLVALHWFITAIKLNTMPHLKTRIRFELWSFLVNKSGTLIERYKLYKLKMYENRLNYRFRWK